MTGRPPGRPGCGRQTAEIIVDDAAWTRAIPRIVRLAARAAQAGGTTATILLSSDRAMRVLNRAHRGIDRPTNVLTFEPSGQSGGDIVLAFGTLRREAAAANKRLADHAAHLIVHGALHLQGEAHDAVGQARRMEQREARILRRIGVGNPWKAAGRPPGGS